MQSTPSGFDIAELARRAGVSSRTIRYYGERGLLPVSGRGAGGRRLYGPDALERLRFITRLKGLGLTLEEIGQLNAAFAEAGTDSMLEELESLLADHQSTIRTRIEDLRRLQVQLGSYLNRVRAKRGAPEERTPPPCERKRA